MGAGLNNPLSLALDSSGNQYITDFGNQRIRKVSTNGTITTVARVGIVTTLGGQATQTFLSPTEGLAVDSNGKFFLSQSLGGDGSRQVLKVGPDGIITAYAGSATAVFSLTNIGDNGPALNAFILPTGLAVDANGNLFIADFRRQSNSQSIQRRNDYDDRRQQFVQLFW